MSEQAKETPTKKKGKLPIVLVLAIVLGAGGFFGMKMRGGDGKKKEPEIKLGATVEIKDEFLCNMAERSSYVRTKIALQVKEGFEGKAIEEDMPAIQDAINMKLQSTSVREVATLEGMRKLKRDLAAAINKILAEKEKKEEHKEEKAKDAEGEGEGEGEEKEAKKAKKHEEEKPKIPEGWDSAKGPVLKVLFVSFATQ